MTQINQNYDMNNGVYVQQQGQARPVASTNFRPQARKIRIPEYYDVSTEEKKSIREQLKSNPITSIPYEFLLRGTEHPIPTILTWLGVSFGLDAYSKACSGDYNKSLLKKVADLGDSLENSEVVKSKPGQFVVGGFGKISNGAKKLAQKSAVLRAIFNTPSMAEWPIVRQEMLPHRLKVCEDFFKITDTLHLADDGKAALSDLVIGNKEKDGLKKFFNVGKTSAVKEEEAVNYILLKQLGKNDTEIKTILNKGAGATEAVKAEIRKTLNNISKETLKEAHKAINDGDMLGEHYKTVFSAAKAGAKKVKIRAGHYGWMGPITKPFERIISCDEIHNKLWSITGGAKTNTGRFFSKIMQMSHRGLTFGQGKLGLLLLIAPSLVDVGRDVIKADPDQKIGTAANGFVESISWVFTFPLALHIMHRFGGIQYAGMSTTDVGNYRKIINDFNEANKTGQYKTKAAYNKAKKNAQKELNKIMEKSNKKLNFFSKGLKKIARAFTMDLETFKAYEGQNFFKKKLQQMPNFFKNCFGVPVRFGVWSVLSMFVLGGLLTKGTQLIFGKAYDSMKNEENKENKKAQKQFLKEDLKERLYKTQVNKQMQTAQTGAVQSPKALQKAQLATHGRGENNFTSEEQLQPKSAKKYDNLKIDNYTYIPSSENIIPSPAGKGSLDSYSYIPSQENKLKKDNLSNPNTRRYIPSQAAANIEKNWDNSGLEDALKRADRAESKAMKILAGNFEGMT